MKHLSLILALILSMAAIPAIGQRVDLGSFTDEVNVTVLESNDNHIIARYEIGAFYKQGVEISGETYYSINLVDEGVLHNPGEPALPRICRSFIIPDNARMAIRTESSEYRDFADMPVVPSKGHLKRTINPADVPYDFGPVYSTDEWYPAQQAAIREPYILRDVRGIVTEIYPFQYNPITKALRVYTSITVELTNTGLDDINVLDRPEPLTAVTPEFDFMYRQRFINYNQSVLLYTPVGEIGDMLVITHDVFHDAVMPYVEWKRQKGIKTTIVDISEIGNNANSIKNFIQDFYDSTNLAFVVLVGDAAQIAPFYASEGASDPTYSKVAGGDNYPDIFVGRISAENLTQVETQITRLVEYEMTPQTSADWYHMATGIASDQGPGHQGEYDFQHMNNIRNDLLDYNYTTVDQIYDPNASAAQVTQALNEGRGLVNYCGHGSWDSWGTTDYGISHVNALTNDNKLPFIISVACNNGEFDNYASCFAESWMRAVHNGEPSGAVGVYMSSISQDWDPPMWAQDEAVDLLVAEDKLTFGGICYNGSCRMIEVEGADGVDMFNTWILFGDPSALIYTNTPSMMAVQHDPSVIFTNTQFNVTIPGEEGALCALYYDGILYGSAYTDINGLATIMFEQALPVGQIMTLTATCYNREPYFGEVTAIAPQGAYVVFDEYGINDEAGNDDGLVDFSESILLDMQLMNVGPDMAYGVSGTLATADSFVTLTDNTAVFGNIAGNFGTVNLENAFGFDVSNQTPDGHIVSFDLTATNGTQDWVSHFTIPVHAPVIDFIDVSIDDSDGNGNGILDAGETVAVAVTIKNIGSSSAANVTGVINEDDEYVTIDENSANFGDFDPGETGNNSSNAYIITAGSNYPPGHSVLFDLAITADGSYSVDLQFMIRAMESFEYDNAGWVGEGAWEWGQPSSGPGSAYDGEKVWATTLGGDYPNNASDGLITTYCTVTSSGATLSFWHWYNMESTYDGGNIKVTADGGESWQLIMPNSGYPQMEISALDNEPGFSGQSGDWQEVLFDLGAFNGETIKIKFNFGSDYMVTAPGWYIDAVIMTGVINWGSNESEITIDQQCINITIDDGDIETRTLEVSNTGEGILEFTAIALADDRLLTTTPENGTEPDIDERYIEKSKFDGITSYNYIGPKTDNESPSEGGVITDFGGPDDFGYTWKDSNEPNGPQYSWIDITAIGTPISGLSDETNLGPFDIGFEFPFYGNTFYSFRACSNGWLSFTSSVTSYSNASLPSGAEPYNLLAPFWDDLNFEDGGEAYYYSNGVDSLVVSYINVAHYSSGGTGPYTFQVILLSNGDITYQYADINTPVDSYTMGIQNENGATGLLMAYNLAYAAPDLAVRIKYPVFWLAVSPTTCTLFPEESVDLTVTFDATEVEAGLYTGNILINSNDPDNPSLAVPCTLHVIPLAIDDDATNALPIVLALDQNYPNPFNPKTEILFGLPVAGQVTLEVYDIMGRRVSTLIDKHLAAGTHKVIWDGTNDNGQSVSSGMYFYKLNQGDNVITRKMVMLK